VGLYRDKTVHKGQQVHAAGDRFDWPSEHSCWLDRRGTIVDALRFAKA
jgi:hypothetical protein